MRLLNNFQAPEELERQVDALEPHQILEHADEIVVLLRHASEFVRMSAVQALSRADTRTDALSARLIEEGDELILAEICESLGDAGHGASAGALVELAKVHTSHLVRSYAAMVTFDILGEEVCELFKEFFDNEKNCHVRATLGVLLAMCQCPRGLESVAEALLDDDEVIRRAVTNILASYAPDYRRAEILLLLERALKREKNRGARLDMKEAVEILRRDMP